MDAKKRRMMVLPAPDGNIDVRDRYEIGIFFSFARLLTAVGRPLRAVYESCVSQKPILFKSKIRDNVFISARKTGKDT